MSFFSATFFSDEFFNTVEAVVDTADYAIAGSYGLHLMDGSFGLALVVGAYGLTEITGTWKETA